MQVGRAVFLQNKSKNLISLKTRRYPICGERYSTNTLIHVRLTSKCHVCYLTTYSFTILFPFSTSYQLAYYRQ